MKYLNLFKQYFLAFVLIGLALSLYFGFKSYKEAKEEKLFKIYAEMQSKQEIVKEAIRSRYSSAEPALIAAMENQAVSILQETPEYKIMSTEARKYETETPLPFAEFGLWALAAILSALMVGAVVYLTSHVDLFKEFRELIVKQVLSVFIALFIGLIALIAVAR